MLPALELLLCHSPHVELLTRLRYGYPSTMGFFQSAAAISWMYPPHDEAWRVQNLSAVGDMLLEPRRPHCTYASQCLTVTDVGLSITTCNKYPVIQFWSVGEVLGGLFFLFPNARTFHVNLEIAYSSVHKKIINLLGELVQKGMQVNTYEVYIIQLPSGDGKLDQKLQEIIQQLGDAGVCMRMTPRGRSQKEVPNYLFRLPAIVRGASIPCALSHLIEDVFWEG